MMSDKRQAFFNSSLITPHSSLAFAVVGEFARAPVGERADAADVDGRALESFDYDAVARVKVRGHWQSDVLVGAGVGYAWGLYAHHRRTPLIMGMMPGRGLMFGYARQF